MKRAIAVWGLLLLLTAAGGGQDAVLRETDTNFSQAGAEDHWIYNDLARGFAEAKASNKPMMIVFRCIP